MMVTDLRHFLDLGPDTPGPAGRLADHLGDIVRAATAGDAGIPWESAPPCRRRPGNRRCPGRMAVLRTNEPQAPIRWQCTACDDQGVISDWEHTCFDLRRRQLTLAPAVHEIVIPDEIASTLRQLPLLDPECERLVFGIRAHHDGGLLAAGDDDLDQLIGAVAAEANHVPDRRRQKRLDAAFDALSGATRALDGR